jgi:hypothetical protein
MVLSLWEIRAIIHGRMDTARASRAGRVTVRRFASAAEANRHDLEYWMHLPEADRVLLTWRLSQELWRLRGDLRDESGLSRSVARILRR